jgi:carbon storage regulator CsrA
MLVFRRQPGESFMVGESVEVRILEIARGQVKIGVVAPREIGIYRSEISRLNRRAALGDVKSSRVKTAMAAVRKILETKSPGGEGRPPG